MKKSVRNTLLLTAAYAVVVWVLLPAGAYWLLGRFSLVRLDPQVSRDYNCIFIEGHARNAFAVPWLSRSTPLQYPTHPLYAARGTPGVRHYVCGSQVNGVRIFSVLCEVAFYSPQPPRLP